MHTGERWRLGRRPGLDGLRGVAILFVVVNHLQLPMTGAAGSVGVTVFFVLSGFLISTLLLEETDRTGKVSIGGFYMRRVRRLLPALIALVTVAGVLLLVGFAVTTPKALIGTMFYVNNWILLDDPASGGWLAATWTLAIEEQFYLIAPFVVILLQRWPRLLLALCGLGVAISVTLRATMFADGTDFYRIYCGTDTRLDGLLVGVGMAVLARRGFNRIGSRIPVAVGAVLLVMYAMPTPRTGTMVVWVPLIAAMATVPLLLHALKSGGVLHAAWLRWTGRRSYAIYLWHLPMTRVADEIGGGKPVLIVFVLVSTAVLAELSWRVVEQSAMSAFRPSESGSDVGVGARARQSGQVDRGLADERR